MTIRVFLLDDHEIVRRGLRELLESTEDIEVIGESASAREAARRIPSLRPDVAIFDARLQDGSGIDACREVRSVDPTIKGLILTSYDDEHALTTAVLAGASAFVLKDIRSNGLIDDDPPGRGRREPARHGKGPSSSSRRGACTGTPTRG